MNKNGFLALYCNGDCYAEIPWTPPTGNQFSIMVRFLPESLPEDGTLFSLDGLSVGFIRAKDSAGHVRLGGRSFYHDSERCAVLKQCKNTLVAVVDGRGVKIYCNGILAVENTLPYDPGRAPGMRIGENLPAVCIFDVTIFHRLPTPSEIQQYCVKKHANFANRILFSTDTAPAGVTLHQCRIENCVYTLDCREGGFYMPDAGLPEKYTVLLSVYLTDQNRRDGILFQLSDFQIKIIYERGCMSPRLIIHHEGEPGFNIPCSLLRYQWINMAFAFDGSRCLVCFDGKLAAEISCHSTKKQAEDIVFGPFDGYMDSCTVVRYAASENQIAGFLENPPGIFSGSLLYLCDFSGRDLLESRRNTPLVSRGAKIVLARGTGALTGVKKEIGAPVSDRPYSEFVNWEIGVLLQLLVTWIHEQFGIYPNRGNIDMKKEPWEVEIGLRRFIHKEILSMPEAQDLLADYNELAPKKLLKLIDAMEKNGTLKKLIDYLYQEEDLDALYEFIRELLKAAMIAAILLALKTMLENLKPLPKPPKMPDTPDQDEDDEDDDDDKKKKKTDIRVKQVSLKGDMRIVTDGGNLCMDSEMAEAKAEEKTRAVFFLKNGTGNHTLKVTLAFKGDKDEFTVSAQNREGQVIAGISQSVSYSGASSVEISCAVHPEKFKGKYGKCTETLLWKCRSKDGKQSQFLGTTDFELYFLEGKPCGPWKDAVPIECLELCADCAAHAGAHSGGFFTDYMNYIRDRTAEQDGSKESFSRIRPEKDRKAVFSAKKFCAAWIYGKLRISRNDWIYSAPVFAYLNGNESVGTMGLCSGITWTEKDKSTDGARLLFKKDGSPEEYFCPEAYVYSVVTNTRGNPETTLIYDARCGANGIPFSADPDSLVTGEYDPRYYREGNFLCGTYCRQYFTLNRNDWTLDDDPQDNCRTAGETAADSAENPGDGLTVGLVGPGPNGYMHTHRTNIDPEVRTHIPRPADEDVDFGDACHSISACQLDLIIADICNAIVRHQQGQATFGRLIEALYPEVPHEGNDFATRRLHFTERLAGTLERRLGNGNRDEITDNLVLHFSYLAGNSPANLHMGRSDWNRFIQDHFDPSAWFYFVDEEQNCVISNVAFDEARPLERLMQTLRNRYGNFPDLPHNQPGYYLADTKDGIRIARLLEMGYQAEIVRRCVMDYGENPERDIIYYPLIACSRNRFPREGAPHVRERYVNLPQYLPPIPIFYIFSDGQGGREWRRLG